MGGSTSRIDMGSDEQLEERSSAQGSCCRLEFAKLLHTRLCPDALQGLMDMDVAEVIGLQIRVRAAAWDGPNPISCASNASVSCSDSDEAGTGWGGTRVYLQTPPLVAPLCALRVVCHAKDQGWGNTGHSRVVLALYRKLKVVYQLRLGSVTHDVKRLALAFQQDGLSLLDGHSLGADINVAAGHQPEARALCAASQSGDVLALVIVSAPYPGFQCKCTDATIEGAALL